MGARAAIGLALVSATTGKIVGTVITLTGLGLKRANGIVAPFWRILNSNDDADSAYLPWYWAWSIPYNDQLHHYFHHCCAGAAAPGCTCTSCPFLVFWPLASLPIDTTRLWRLCQCRDCQGRSPENRVERSKVSNCRLYCALHFFVYNPAFLMLDTTATCRP